MDRRNFLQLTAGLAALSTIPAPLLKPIQKNAELNAYLMYEKHLPCVRAFYKEFNKNVMREFYLHDFEEKLIEPSF